MSKKKQTHKQTAQPHWQPIEKLPMLSTHINGMLEADVEQYQNLLQAKSKPWLLDDFTVNRVKEVFGRQRKDFDLYDGQLRRWSALSLTEDQRAEVTRLVGQMKKLRENNTNVLQLAEELSKGTLEKQLAKDDAELGLEMLLRMMNGN